MTFNNTEKICAHLAVVCLTAGGTKYLSDYLADYIEPKQVIIVGCMLMFYYFLYFGLRYLKVRNETRKQGLLRMPFHGANCSNVLPDTKPCIDMEDSFNPNDMSSSLYFISRMKH